MGKAPKQLSLEVLHLLKSALHSLDSKYPVVSETQWAELVNFSTNSDFPVHRWFRNREGYSIQLVQSVLEQIQESGLVVDPFCGTGTTLLASALKGYSSIGIDVNPLATFISSVKTRCYDETLLENVRNACADIKLLHPNLPSAHQPQLSIIDQVFLPEVLHALLVSKYYINQHLPQVERDLLFAAWLSILEEVSNTFREGNGIKYRNRKRTPNGYIQIPLDLWQKQVFPDDKFAFVIQTLIARIELMLNDIEQIGFLRTPVKICNGPIKLDR